MPKRESGFVGGISAPKAERGGRENEAINERLTAVGGELAATFDRVQGIDWESVSPEQRERARLSVLEVLGHVANLPISAVGAGFGGLLALQGVNQMAAGDLLLGPYVLALGAWLSREFLKSGKQSLDALTGKE
jgi:hypothetical protein